MAIQPPVTREKIARGFAGDANRPLTAKTSASAGQRMLVVVPGTWDMDASLALRDRIEDLGHVVSMLRTDDMMRIADLEEAVPNKDVIFLYIREKHHLERALELAKKHAIAAYAASVPYGQVIHHIQMHARSSIEA